MHSVLAALVFLRCDEFNAMPGRHKAELFRLCFALPAPPSNRDKTRLERLVTIGKAAFARQSEN